MGCGLKDNCLLPPRVCLRFGSFVVAASPYPGRQTIVEPQLQYSRNFMRPLRPVFELLRQKYNKMLSVVYPLLIGIILHTR
jgi:hypothetical protein